MYPAYSDFVHPDCIFGKKEIESKPAGFTVEEASIRILAMIHHADGAVQGCFAGAVQQAKRKKKVVTLRFEFQNSRKTGGIVFMKVVAVKRAVVSRWFLIGNRGLKGAVGRFGFGLFGAV